MIKARLTALALTALLVTGAAAGCAKETNPAITFRDTVITENEYIYYMSSYKGTLLSAMGQTYDNPAVWTIEIADGMTSGEFYGLLAANDMIATAVAVQLFDEYGLSLTREEEAQIDEIMSQLESDAGGRSALTDRLSAYGVDIEMLRGIKKDQLKAAKLQNYLYGENGIEAATVGEVEAYYRENYLCERHIFISNSIKYILDENGQPQLSEDGSSYLSSDLTPGEKAEKEALVKDIELSLTAGEDFEELLTKYTMDLGMHEFTDGYYFMESNSIFPPTLVAATAEMEIGEIRTVASDEGWYIIKRCELGESPYTDEKYAPVMFSGIATAVNTEKMQELFGSFSDEIVIAEDIIANYPLANCTANFKY